MRKNFSRACCLLSMTLLSMKVIGRSCLQIVQDEVPINANPPRKNYSALVVFGDSYSDDGHARKPEDKHSFSSPPAAGGRFTDGPVWDEFLAQNLSAFSSITFRNYAFNGAHINNKLSNPSTTPVPDTAAQIETYLHSLQADGQPAKAIVDGRMLYALWIGINPLIVMWTSDTYGNTTLRANTLLTPELVGKIDQQIEELSKQVAQLLENSAFSKLQSDYMLLTIPPLTPSKLAQDQATVASKGQTASKEDYLNLLSQMTDYFNLGLRKAADDLRQKNRGPSRKDAIFVFDTEEFWNEVISNPDKFGIESLETCYVAPEKPCKQPDKYMYWDILHPSSTFHAQLAIAIQKYLEKRDEHVENSIFSLGT